MDKNEFKSKLEQIEEPTTTQNETVSKTAKKLSETEIPDFIDFLKSEEHIREGKNSKMPLKIDYNGKPYRVYVRPLTSQEYYRIQLDAMNKKESIDLLACQTAMIDANGENVDPLLLGTLKAGTIQEISAGIRLISGIDTQDMDYGEIMEYFLKT